MKIRIEDLFYLYARDGRTTVALRGLHLEIASGECLVINGPNGSGKSTLVKILTGFQRASAGQVFFGELEISDLDPLRLRREFIASIDQNGNLLKDLTVMENIVLACALNEDSYSLADFRASALLEQYDLLPLADRFPQELSASERQMCSLVAALATNPKILIADEPSGELDDAAAATIYASLRGLAGKMTIILVTHDERAESIADRVVRIRNGRISETWTPGSAEESVIDPFGWTRIKQTRESKSHRRRRPASRNGAAEPAFLEAIDLSLSYGEKRVFSRVRFTAHPGEIIAVAAPSGQGKSSLLRILAGVQKPSHGTCTINAQSIHELSREERAALRAQSIGYMGQGSDPLQQISLADHLGKNKDALQELFGSTLQRSLSEFSGGERAQIEIMKLLTQAKPLLLFDEPTSQLDESHTAQTVELLLRYVKNGGIVITSTRESLLLQQADRVVILTNK
jgi:peptide/nickel transport system ATP-binding protein/energy-coupling factor transport system ATP-binding protein